jgi:hypothetical protein
VLGQDAEQRLTLSEAHVEVVIADQAEAEFVALVRGFWARVNRRDSAAVVEMVHPEALFVTTGVRKDRAQLLADFAPWEGGGDSGLTTGFQLDGFKVIALSESAVIITYTLEWEQVHPRIPSRMFDSQVWVKQEGRWVLVFAHDSVADLIEFLGSAM